MRIKFKRWHIWSLIIVVGIFLYQVSGYFLLYCNDAYVDADFVVISPQVSGIVAEVPVSDNQLVHKGDVVLKLDPTPYALTLAQSQAEYRQAQAQLQLAQLKLKDDQVSLGVAKQQLDLANETLQRYVNLARQNAVSQDELSSQQSQQSTVLGAYLTATATVQQDQQAIVVQESVVASSKSAVALAAYNLSLTTLTAPATGYINHLRIRPGNYVAEDTPLFGLVADRSWYVVANYKERALSHIHPGQSVWVMLSSNVGHVYHGTVISFGRAVARDDTTSDAALPYIAPTTDWIRYPYRFPVTISIPDLPADVPIGKGADAHTIIFVK